MTIGYSRINTNQLPEEMDKIKLEFVSKSELPEGSGYAIKLKNGNSFLIKQNTVYNYTKSRIIDDNLNDVIIWNKRIIPLNLTNTL